MRTRWSYLTKCIILLPSLLIAGVRSQKPLTDWMDGQASNYGSSYDGMDPYSPSFGTSEGSCGYGKLDKEKYPYWSVAALSTSSKFYKQGPVQGCGQCFQIECINDGPQYQGRCNQDPSLRSATVMITDACPQCEADRFDVQALTFNKVAPMSVGRIAIRYRQVECAPPADLRVQVDENAGSGGWLRLLVEEAAVAGSVKSVQCKGKDSDWQGLNNIWGATWEINTSPQPPLDIRIVASDGQEVTAFGAIKSGGVTGTLPTGVQFSYGSVPAVEGTQSAASASASASSSSDGPLVSAFSGPDDGTGGSSSGSSDDSVPCITAFQGSTVNPSNCATRGSQTGSTSSSSSGQQSSQPDSPAPAPDLSGAATPGPDRQIIQQRYLRGPPASDVPPSPPSSAFQKDSCSCNDVTPPGGYSCSQQKNWGACSASWMSQAQPDRPNGYCAKTCNRCKC